MEAVEKFNCQREKSFSELFGALGDREKQDSIRSRVKGTKHCRWLQKSSTACARFPEEVKDGNGIVTVQIGDPCPNNPLVKHPEIYEMEDRYISVISEISKYEDMIALNLLPSIEELTPVEFQICSILRKYMTAEEHKAQMLTRQMDITQVMSGAFGGSREGGKGRRRK